MCTLSISKTVRGKFSPIVKRVVSIPYLSANRCASPGKILASFYRRKCSVTSTDWYAPSTGDTVTVVAFPTLPLLSAPLFLEILVLETGVLI
jgi:hypothetical protein